MKTKFILTGFVIACCCFTACEKSTEGGRGNKGDNSSMSQLNVPDGFKWETIKDVMCNFNTDHSSKVSIYLSESCKNEDLLVEDLIVAPSMKVPLLLSLPTPTGKLYTQYETAEGTKHVISADIINGKITFQLPTDSKPLLTTRASDVQDAEGYYYYPAKDAWGTIMFEDLFPGLGDFDFNDVVFNYKIKLFVDKAEAQSIYQMVTEVRVKAIGGSLPNDIYLQLDGIAADKIVGCTVRDEDGDRVNSKTIEATLIPNQPIIKIAKFGSSSNVSGAHFFNTEKGYEIDNDKLIRVKFTVVFSESPELSRLTLDKLNFFIGRQSNENFHEVHIGGFAPSSLGAATYEAERTKENSGIDPDRYYYGNKLTKKLVWGLNVPADIPHAYESTDFIAAYPNFMKWVTSGGNSNKDWYEDSSDNRKSENLCD